MQVGVWVPDYLFAHLTRLGYSGMLYGTHVMPWMAMTGHAFDFVSAE